MTGAFMLRRRELQPRRTPAPPFDSACIAINMLINAMWRPLVLSGGRHRQLPNLICSARVPRTRARSYLVRYLVVV